MSIFDLFLPLTCPNPECLHNIEQFATRPNEHDVFCPRCNQRLNLGNTSAALETIDHLSNEIVDIAVDACIQELRDLGFDAFREPDERISDDPDVNGPNM